MAAQAITAQALRDQLRGFGNFEIPDGMTDPELLKIVERQTAVVLTLRGLNALPSDMTSQEGKLVENLTMRLSLNEARRSLRPDDAEFQSFLLKEEMQLREENRATEHQGLGARFMEIV